MEYQNLIYRLQGRVALILLNRPKALNALSLELMVELGLALDRAAADAEVRAVVLSGEGRAFSSGADLATGSAAAPRDTQGRLDLGLALEQGYNPLILKMRDLPKPVIAAVNGLAAGAGASVALMADLTIAARSAYFLQAFVNVGLIPDAGGTWLLPQALGSQRAMGLTLLGEKLPAEQARDWGLIWDVVDDAELMPAALKLATRLAEGPALAIERIKRAIYAAASNSLSAQLDLERDLQRECGRSEDLLEGVLAFMQKRQAKFKGK